MSAHAIFVSSHYDNWSQVPLIHFHRQKLKWERDQRTFLSLPLWNCHYIILMTELEQKQWRGKEQGENLLYSCYWVAPNMLCVQSVHTCMCLSSCRPQVSQTGATRAESAVSMRIGIGVCRGGEEKAGHSTGRANIHKSKPLKRVWPVFCVPQGRPQFQSSN